jgi:hypothetical protein
MKWSSLLVEFIDQQLSKMGDRKTPCQLDVGFTGGEFFCFSDSKFQA